jgi:small-conductance mechanosensitive channel
VVLDIWGVPTSPLLLLIAVIVLIAIVAFRDTAPNLFASFQIAATQEIKVGDYIKLEGNEEGYITEISWNTTRLRALDGSITLVPNNFLIHRKVINYGRPLKKAKEPFYFNTQTHMAELTGLKARNLQELIYILKKVPDSVIYPSFPGRTSISDTRVIERFFHMGQGCPGQRYASRKVG